MTNPSSQQTIYDYSEAREQVGFKTEAGLEDYMGLKADVNSLKQAQDNPPSTDVKVNELSGGGAVLAGGVINSIQDSDNYLMPLASIVDAGVICVFEVDSTHSTETPTVTCQNSDVFRNADGTDPVIKFLGMAKITAISNGVSEWVI